jgi:indoleacetamide hydrolase
MSHNKEADAVSRRHLLQAAAAIVPLHVGSRIVAALEPRGQSGAMRQSADVLALGAREVVARIARGDITAEAYAALLLKQYDAHKDLNVATAIDASRVLEAARGVDRLRARGTKLGPAAGLPFAVKDQISVTGYPNGKRHQGYE